MREDDQSESWNFIFIHFLDPYCYLYNRVYIQLIAGVRMTSHLFQPIRSPRRKLKAWASTTSLLGRASKKLLRA